MTSKELLVSKIENGTVIDHIPSGQGLRVFTLIGPEVAEHETAVVLVNIPSRHLGTKDIVKIKNRELTSREVNKIALTAPTATLNIIRNWEVADKRMITIPHAFEEVAKCPNSNCVTNSQEPVLTRFIVEEHDPLGLRCVYCERSFSREEISSFIT